MSELRETLINITEEKNAKIIPSNIKEGVQIFDVVGEYKGLDTSDATAEASDIVEGVVAYANGNKLVGTFKGVDTSDATAVAANILSGKTAYIKGQKVSGIMVNLGYKDITPGENAKTVGPGFVQQVTVYGDSNLQSKYIVEGRSIFGVRGNVVPVSSLTEATISASDVRKGKVAYNNYGHKTEGTLEPLDTSDATATAEQLLEGYTAYARGEKIVGTKTIDDENNATVTIPEGTTAVNTIGQILTSIKDIDTSGLNNTSYMFNSCSALQTIPSLNLENVMYTIHMFLGCKNLRELGEFNIPQLKELTGMFHNCHNLIHINGSMVQNTKYHTPWANVFANCYNLISLPNFVIGNTNNLERMFYQCRKLENIDMGGYNGVGPYQIRLLNMCYNCTNLRSFGNLSMAPASYQYNVMATDAFYNCVNLETVSNFHLYNNLACENMFYNCSNLVSLENCSFGTFARGNNIFYNCTNLINGFENGYVSITTPGQGATHVYNTFYQCSNLTFNNGWVNARLYANNGYVSQSFVGCNGITSANLTLLGAAQYGQVSSSFQNCSNLISANVNISSGNHSGIFANCSKLQQVNITDSGTLSLARWFAGCNSINNIIQQINCNWNNVRDIVSSFENCYNLTNLQGFTIDNVRCAEAFRNCINLTDTNGFNATQVTNVARMFANCYNLKSISGISWHPIDNQQGSIYGLCANCLNLTDLQPIEFYNASIINHYRVAPFGEYNDSNCLPLVNLVNVGGFINYGIGFNTYGKSANNMIIALDIVKAPHMSYQSLQNVINGVYNLYTAYGIAEGGTLTYPQLIRMANTQYEKLTEDDIGILTSKGWNITVHNIGG